MNNVVAIVQARMGASRLPGKMMLDLKGDPIIKWIYQRLLKAQLLDAICFAVADTDQDLVLVDYLKELGAHVFIGSERNVLERFYQAAQQCRATHVVRVCADNPVICGEVVDELVDFYFNNDCDYAYNHIPIGNTYPDGLGAEMVSMRILDLVYKKAVTAQQQEHIFNVIWDNKDYFMIKTFNPANKNLEGPTLKLDLDTKQDYQRLVTAPIEMNMCAEEIVKIFKELA